MATFLDGKERTFVALTDATRTQTKHLPASALGRPNVNPPDIVLQDNTEMLAFTVGTDQLFISWEVPAEYAGGDLTLQAHWTNDGGVDDNGLDVKLQVDYQTYDDGDAISGDHANSPKSIEDTYASAAGWIMFTTGVMTIAAADFAGKHVVAMKLSFVAPAGGALTADPHLLGFMIMYSEEINS